MGEATNNNDDWAAAFAEEAKAQGTPGEQAPQKAYQPAPLQTLRDDGVPRTDVNLDVILDIPVTISMEIGRTKLSIRNLLQLNQGSVVELDRLAGEPLDVLVNGTLIAHGEVVVVNEKYGIRLTDVISAAERVQKLR
jgi:flagellar motor switch protein FliN/FliY